MAKQIDRALLKAIHDDVNVALAIVAKKHGVLLSMGNARFTTTSATMKMDISIADAGTIAAGTTGGVTAKTARAEADFKAYATMHGLKPEWLHTSVMIHGKSLEIAGLLPNKHKNVVLVRGTGGGQYIISAREILAAK